MQPFITFRETNEEGQLEYYILQKDFPHFLGRIAYHIIPDSLCQVPISGHALYLTFSGTLRGNVIPNYRNIAEEINETFEKMALWFYDQRVLPEPKKYQKWKISTAPSTTS